MQGQLSAVLPHNEKSAAVWGAPGSRYEDVSRGLDGAIAHAVARLAPRRGERILDVACGTGRATCAAAEAADGVQVTGVDIAGGLIEAARRFATERGLQIEFQTGDAEHLPYADGTFDGVLSSFGVMFASRPEAAAAELTRVVRRGGRMALLVWKPQSAVFEMFKVMRPYLPAPAATPPPSPFEWGHRDRIAALFGDSWDLGFEEGVQPLVTGSALEAWDIFRHGYGPIRAIAGQLADDRARQFEGDMLEFFGRYSTDLGVFKPREYLLVGATRR